MPVAGNSKSYSAGEVIIRENTPGDCAYIVLRGKVDISKVIDGQRVVLDTLGPGSIFGEMSLLDGRPRSATATAAEDTLLSAVDRSRFQGILESIPREVRPLFSSLSERLRHTSQLVSVLNQRERLIYSSYALLRHMLPVAGEEKNGVMGIALEDVVYEGCRVLAVDRDRLEEVLRSLADTPLAMMDETGEKPRLLVPDINQLAAFVEFLSEKLSYIPGFPPPQRKFASLSEKAQRVLFHLRNKAGDLPVDEQGGVHYDFDKYVKHATEALDLGVKDAIITLQNLAGAGHVRLEKFSQQAQNKAIVFRPVQIGRAQEILLQAEEFERIYRGL